MGDVLAFFSHFDLIERTSSTARVQQVVQLSLAPAFLLAGIGAVMFAISGDVLWLVLAGVGVALGLGIGAAVEQGQARGRRQTGGMIEDDGHRNDAGAGDGQRNDPPGGTGAAR